MPETTLTRLPKSEIKIEFVVSPEEARPYLEEAAKDLTTAKPIPGFRPGKTSYEDTKRFFGEMKILEAALERLIRAHYAQIILREDLHVVGSPAISVEQLTPEQPIKFTVTAPIEPVVETFPNLDACRVAPRNTEVTDTQVSEAIEEMRKMRRTEARVDRPATMEDLVIVDLEMKKDQVPIDSGSGRDYRVYLNESHYIPGFTKALEGIKEGEARTFSLPFPSEHYQKHLAGQNVDFTAKATGIFEMQLPPLDETFAKGVGLDTMEALQKKLKENLEIEMQQKADEASEIEMLDKLIDGTGFSEIPDILVTEEVRRMLEELQQSIEEREMKWADYLSSIKKSADELRLDFSPQAVRRIKAAVLIKSFAKQQNVEVPETELDAEVDRILTHIRPEDHETRERIASPQYRDYISVQLRNRKVLEWLKKECVK